MTDYKRWCLHYGQKLDNRTHDDWIKEFTKWVFGKQPPYPDRPGNPLFVHGDMKNNNQSRRMQVSIYKNDPIIVHVVGANFVKGDKDKEGNTINSDQEIKDACNAGEHEDQPGNVQFKIANEKDFTDLSSCVEQLRPEVFDFEVDGSNSDLKSWDVEMPKGPQRGAWSCQLLLLKIPEPGDYLLNFDAKCVPPFESRAEYKIDVK
jgi:hypothetical protein